MSLMLRCIWTSISIATMVALCVIHTDYPGPDPVSVCRVLVRLHDVVCHGFANTRSGYRMVLPRSQSTHEFRLSHRSCSCRNGRPFSSSRALVALFVLCPIPFHHQNRTATTALYAIHSHWYYFRLSVSKHECCLHVLSRLLVAGKHKDI